MLTICKLRLKLRCLLPLSIECTTESTLCLSELFDQASEVFFVSLAFEMCEFVIKGIQGRLPSRKVEATSSMLALREAHWVWLARISNCNWPYLVFSSSSEEIRLAFWIPSFSTVLVCSVTMALTFFSFSC